LRSLEFAELRIPITQIRQGIQDFEFTTDRPEMQVGMPGADAHEASVKAHVTPLGQDTLIELSAQNRGTFLCDRCGEPFDQTIQGHVKTLFVNASSADVREESEEVRLLPAETQFIDILQDAVDALLLAVPTKNLCGESCKGLCPRCGKNLNEGPCSCQEEPEDSRWEALKNIRFDP
jgi:uncharacterized protein